MITLASALEQFQTTLEKAFTSAGFVDGTSLSAAKIKSESKPLFWFMNITNQSASDKGIYLTYDIVDLDPIQYGDGTPLVRRARSIINIYSKKRSISSLITAINASCIVEFDNFELNTITYDSSIQRYQYSFRVAADINAV